MALVWFEVQRPDARLPKKRLRGRRKLQIPWIISFLRLEQPDIANMDLDDIERHDFVINRATEIIALSCDREFGQGGGCSRLLDICMCVAVLMYVEGLTVALNKTFLSIHSPRCSNLSRCRRCPLTLLA